jgi:hypothetical protein
MTQVSDVAAGPLVCIDVLIRERSMECEVIVYILLLLCYLTVYQDGDFNRGVTIYRYIAIQNKIIQYRDIKVTYRIMVVFFLDVYWCSTKH